MMEKKLKFIFFAIEINLILWLIALFSVQPEVAARYGGKVVLFGFIISAILQHWAYYSIYKKLKKK